LTPPAALLLKGHIAAASPLNSDHGVEGTIPRSRLELAEAREQRLLQYGVSDIYSPLDGKRRGRSDASMAGGGVVLSSLEAISRQLQKNASVQFQHSPGLPTALAVNSKFIAVGTDRSLVLVFDHFQEIRHILGSGADSAAQGPVTCLDMSTTDFLVAGFVSGKIVLFDLLKGSVLKAVDLHDSPISAMRFIHDSVIVSGNPNGMKLASVFS
jgi:WD40 repeat protein